MAHDFATSTTQPEATIELVIWIVVGLALFLVVACSAIALVYRRKR